ncbi:NADP-dependent 3-hydroxy acid dehydrogenase YdfG [Lishizhenia tianjinensis]|uniref:NADP-dependent 3-hydroxy acid dehydrogenase YdfG n=1 Tax=Lishizhenia tianjinensis TaxID=477690 RepID=A0A1I7A5Q3_9FLAO|nr:SDR family NAD(P)-dependent oxidoreductase [Lishizhenia tianjinensis]SFT70245.1 NADP-dependent 3-hydroxy acid dehydrogenase YdfG [Lishizhenia tianjinensis]
MKTILITGATSGFGLAIAKKFYAQGYNLILTGRRKERFAEIESILTELGEGKIHFLHFDVRNNEAVKQAVNQIPADLANSLSILVNNAGLALGRSTIDAGVTEDWDAMMDTNVKGLLYVSKAVIPLLQNNGGGQIVNIASIAGKEVYPGGNVYCASKHAVDALSRAMRIDLLKDNIAVSNIAPGAADTEFSLVRFKGDAQTAKDVYKGYTPLFAEDIADAVEFVCNRPRHVNIDDLLIMPRAQANATIFKKEEN